MSCVQRALVGQSPHPSFRPFLIASIDTAYPRCFNSTIMMAPAHNPFGAPTAKPASNPFAPAGFGQPSAQATAFGVPSISAPTSQQQQPPRQPAVNPFGPSGTTPAFGVSSQPSNSTNGAQHKPSPFGAMTTSTASPFGAPAQQSTKNPSPFASNENPFGQRNAQSKKPRGPSPSNAFGQKSPTPENPFGKDLKQGQAKGPAAPFGAAKMPVAPVNGRTTWGSNQLNAGGKKKHERVDSRPSKPTKLPRGITPQPTPETRRLSSFAGDFAEKLQNHLRKDGLSPPQWPAEPGNPDKRGPMEKLKESYKKYRTKVYSSLRKAELIDDPDKRRRLEDALPFKGVCEDMCPDYERVTRITEYDVKHEEKECAPDGRTMWAEPARMVKKFGRSAAGQDAPLPMDVRSVDALKRTTDYLLDDLLQSDQDLPVMHNFLWDRTRAVRKDFTFHSTKSTDEMKVLVYCFETITRFHATALHLLSRKGFAAEDFDQKQEIEQLGRSLLSLIEAYDDCRAKGVQCENEPEFRAYHLLLNTHDPFIVQRSLEWGREPWYNSDEVQLALMLIHSMQSVQEPRGPSRPSVGASLSDSSFTNFFSIVEGPEVSYTMACFAAVHFTHVRQRLLNSLVKAYSRRRDSPRDLTAAALNRVLRFDNDEEAVEFAELHGFEFSSEKSTLPYMVMNSKQKHVPSPRVLQSYSGKLVERKRNGQSLAYVIHHTVYEKSKLESKTVDDDSDGLFVSQSGSANDSTNQPDADGDNAQNESSPTPFQPPPSSAEKGTSTSTAAKRRPVPSVNPFYETPTPSPTTSPRQNQSPFQAAQAPSAPAAPAQTTASSLFGVPSSSAQQPANNQTSSPFFGAPTSSSLVSIATQPSTTTAAPSPFSSPFSSFKSPTPAASHVESSQPAAAPKVFFPNASSPTFPSGPSSKSIFSAPGQPEPQATPAVSGAPAAFLGTGTNDHVPSVKISPPTPTWPSQGHTTTQGADATRDPRHPTPQQSAASSLAGTSVTPSAGFFPTAATAKETTSASAGVFGPAAAAKETAFSPASQALSTPKTSDTTGSDNKTQPPPPAAGPIFGLPQASQAATPTAAETTPGDVKTIQSPGLLPQAQVAPPGLPGSLFNPPQAAQIPTTQTTAGQPQTTSKDLMGDFTKWFVSGDGGLMEQFTQVAVQDLLQETFEKWQEEEEERKRKEEDQKSWEAARKHRRYSLRLKYFYLWRENARTRALRRILRDGRAKMKAYRLKERAAEKARKEEEIKVETEARRKARSEENIAKLLQWDTGRKSAQLRTEEQLLASGIFSGIRDEREAVRRVIREVSIADASKQQFSAPSSVASSEATMPPPSSFKRDGWKTRSLREKYGRDSSMRRSDRRSNSVSSSVITASDFSRSLPATKITNFSRKRYAQDSSDEEPSPKRKANGIQSKHWELRARGLVLMPDGQWLPESIALPMQEGKRFKGIGDCGLGKGTETPREIQSEGEESIDIDAARSRLDRLAARFGFSKPRRPPPPPSAVSDVAINGAVTPPGKRKRPIDAEESSPTFGLPGDDGSSPSAKKRLVGEGEGDDTQRMVEDTQKMLQELKDTMDQMDEDRPWFREQVELMEKRQSMWD